MKEQPRTSFRAAPHTSGETAVKLKDYLEAGLVEATNSYEAWESLRSTDTPLEIGDILENELGEIRIYKYVGFESAKWILPETKPAMEVIPAAAGIPTAETAAGKI